MHINVIYKRQGSSNTHRQPREDSLPWIINVPLNITSCLFKNREFSRRLFNYPRAGDARFTSLLLVSNTHWRHFKRFCWENYYKSQSSKGFQWLLRFCELTLPGVMFKNFNLTALTTNIFELRKGRQFEQLARWLLLKQSPQWRRATCCVHVKHLFDWGICFYINCFLPPQLLSSAKKHIPDVDILHTSYTRSSSHRTNSSIYSHIHQATSLHSRLY